MTTNIYYLHFFRYLLYIIMRFKNKIFIIVLIIPILSFSQTRDTEKTSSIKINSSIFHIDSFSIIPNSLIVLDVDSNEILSSKYVYNEIDAKIKILDSSLIGETLIFKYEIYPVLLSRSYYHRQLKHIEPENYITEYWIKKKKRDVSIDPSISKQGSISRNIMIGNNQDLSVLSNIDLRLAGKLSEKLNIFKKN